MENGWPLFGFVLLCFAFWAPGEIKTFLAFRQQVGVQIFHKDLNDCLSAIVSATVYPNFVVNRLKLKNLM